MAVLPGGLNAWKVRYPNQLLVASGGLSRTLDAAGLRGELTVLVDLRGAADFAQSHLAGAVNVLPSALTTSAVGLPKDVTLVVYDASGAATAYAVALRSQGFAKAVDLVGGLNLWKQQLKNRLLVLPSS